MKTIILDTNALMAIGQFKIDIFSEIDKLVDFKFRIAVLDKTILELKKIIDLQGGKTKAAAKLSLEMVKAKKIKILAGGESKDIQETYADDLLVGRAEKGDLVLTQDRELKQRIKAIGGQLLTLRQKKKVVWA